MTKKEKIQVLIKIIPILLILLILLIMLLVKPSVSDQRDPVQSPASASEESETQTPDENMSVTEAPSAAPSVTMLPAASPTPYREVMETEKVDYSHIAFNTEEQLKEMMSYWEEGNQKALDDLVNLERFKAMSYQLKGTKNYFYYGDKNSSSLPDGLGIAVYADNQYYYGEWKNGVREGQGKWMHYHIHLTDQSDDLVTYHQYTGGFVNDLPEGDGQEHYDFRQELLKENVGYNSNYLGTYRKGLLDGEFYITNLYRDGNLKEWNATAKEGSFLYQNKNKDTKGRGPVMVDTRNPDNYIWMSQKENQNLGVLCYISDKK